MKPLLHLISQSKSWATRYQAYLVAGVVLIGLLLVSTWDSSGLSSGFSHPFAGGDHLVTMLAVGIWAAQLRGHAIWALPAAFVGVMSLGGLVGAIGLQLPVIEAFILLSCGVFGVLITRRIRFSAKVNISIVAFFGFFHGFAHGQEISASAGLISYVLGFVLATLVLHGAGILFTKGLFVAIGFFFSLTLAAHPDVNPVSAVVIAASIALSEEARILVSNRSLRRLSTASGWRELRPKRPEPISGASVQYPFRHRFPVINHSPGSSEVITGCGCTSPPGRHYPSMLAPLYALVPRCRFDRLISRSGSVFQPFTALCQSARLPCRNPDDGQPEINPNSPLCGNVPRSLISGFSQPSNLASL